MEIPVDPVPRDYIANIANGETIIYGDTVRPGMIVLIEDDLTKENPPNEDDSLHRYRRYMENNRWSRVVSVHQDVHYYGEDEPSNTILKMVCEYANGDIMARSFNASYAWVVKEESIQNVTVLKGEAVANAAKGIYEAAAAVDPWPAMGENLILDGTPLVAKIDMDGALMEPEVNFGAQPAWAGFLVETDNGIIKVGEVDPELEKLIAEEEEIEAKLLAAEQAEPEFDNSVEDLYDEPGA